MAVTVPLPCLAHFLPQFRHFNPQWPQCQPYSWMGGHSESGLKATSPETQACLNGSAFDLIAPRFVTPATEWVTCRDRDYRQAITSMKMRLASVMGPVAVGQGASAAASDEKNPYVFSMIKLQLGQRARKKQRRLQSQTNIYAYIYIYMYVS